jgi:hypothetical protein
MASAADDELGGMHGLVGHRRANGQRCIVGCSEDFLGDASEERSSQSLSGVRGHRHGSLGVLADDAGDGARRESASDDDRFGIVDSCLTGSFFQVSPRFDDYSAVARS